MQSVITKAQPIGRYQHVGMPLGMSIEGICKHVFGTVSGIVAYVRCPKGARQKWEVVPQHLWKHIKPKGKNCIKFEFYPAGGSNSNLFATIAAVLISVAAPYLATTVLGLTAGTFAATAATAAIAIGGNLLVSKLFAAEAPNQQSVPSEQAAEAFNNVDSDSNILGKGIPAPQVHGLRRVTLPDLCNPHRYLENGIDVIERCIGATDYHSLTAIEVAKVDIASLDGVEYQIRDGQESAPQQDLIKRVTKTKSVSGSLDLFTLKNDSNRIVDQTTPANSEPKTVTFAPGYHADMEQITVRLNLERFIYQYASEDVTLPLRITLKDKAGVVADINVPEIFISGRKNVESPKEIKIRRDDNFGFSAASPDFDYTFFKEVPATSSTLSDGSTGTQWSAHSNFSSGTGIRDTKNITGSLDSINIKLGPNEIPWADYEVSITAGLPFRTANFSTLNYQLNGSVESLFKTKSVNGNWVIPSTINGIFAGAGIEFSVLVVKRYPVEVPGVAQIALRFPGISAKAVTCLAGLYVNDYGGSDWDNLIVTKNPAPHFRHVLRRGQKFSRVSYALNSDDQFEAWREECIARGYEVNFVSSGQAMNEVLGHLATAGFATRRFGTGYGIDFHRDRSADVPEQTFSHRDSKITIERVFSDSPKGYLVDFDNEDDDWSNNGPITINNPWGSATLAANEQKSYPSISNEKLVRQRTEFDALQEAYRNKVYKIDTGPAGFNRERGELVGVVTDLDSDYAHGFYVRQVVGENKLVLDRSVPVEDSDYITDYVDITIEEDILAGGANSTVHLVTPGGVEVYTIANVAENTITFTTNLPASWTIGGASYLRSSLQGTRLTVSANGDLFKRCLVTDVKRRGNQRSTVYAVEEMPIIEEILRKKYA